MSVTDIKVIFAPTSSNSEMGGKAANLQRLQNISGILVPYWFCISTRVFQQFLFNNKIDPQALPKKELRERILQSPLDPKEWSNAYESFCESLGEGTTPLVAVRSSGVLEDQHNSSCAGIYDTYLNRRGIEEIDVAIKQVWASLYNDRSGSLSHQMAVIIQKQVSAVVFGVATTIELSSNYPGIEIAANQSDSGEAVVSGKEFVNKWLFHSEKDYLIKSVSHLDVLKNDHLYHIANQVKKIRSIYSCEIDTEFAIDKAGALFFLQARPLIHVPSTSLQVVDSKPDNVIARGYYSLPGVVQGVLKFIESWEDLSSGKVSIESNDIVMVYVAINYWSHYLTKCKGLITKQGGPTSHPIILCRERNIPCVIGIEDDFEKLFYYVGKEVTLDGINRVVLKGHVQVKRADLSQVFRSVQVKPWPSIQTRRNELLKGGFAFEEKEELWIQNPTYPIKKLFQSIHLKRFDRMSFLAFGKNKINFEAKLIDQYTCFKLYPIEKSTLFFSQFSLEDCIQYGQNQADNMWDFVRVTKNFQLNPKNWQQYIDVFTDFKAYHFLAEIFRHFLERELECRAETLALPEHYLEEYLAQIQSGLTEEDTLMQQAVYDLASKMIINSDEDFTEEINILARSYRFARNVSIDIPLDISLVENRLRQEADEIKNGKQLDIRKTKSSIQVEFFPEHRELKTWAHILVQNRVLQSNSHHYQVRGQWEVRRELIKLNHKDIFDLTPEEIKGLLV